MVKSQQDEESAAMEHPAIRLPEVAARHQAIHRLRPAGCPHRRQHDARRHDGVLIGGARVAVPHIHRRN